MHAYKSITHLSDELVWYDSILKILFIHQNLRDDFKVLSLWPSEGMKTVTRSTTFSLIPLLLFEVDALVERFQHMRRTRPDGSCILVGRSGGWCSGGWCWLRSFRLEKMKVWHRLKLYTKCLQRLCVSSNHHPLVVQPPWKCEGQHTYRLVSSITGHSIPIFPPHIIDECLWSFGIFRGFYRAYFFAIFEQMIGNKDGLTQHRPKQNLKSWERRIFQAAGASCCPSWSTERCIGFLYRGWLRKGPILRWGHIFFFWHFGQCCLRKTPEKQQNFG